MRRVTAPARLRRRLTIAFALVAALATGALAGGAYVLVRQARMQDSLERSLRQTRLNLRIAEQNLATAPRGSTVRSLIDVFGGGGFESVVVAGATFQSTLSIGTNAVPRELAGLVTDGDLAYERTTIDGAPYLVTGSPVPGRNAEAYFFFPERRLTSELAQLGTILAAGSLAFIALAAIVGAVVAKRVLAPVGRASTAARALAEGLLTTRLPVETDDEFGAWALSFNEMARALESKISELTRARERERRFTSDVAHELRTPLTALVGAAGLLRQHVDEMPEPARRPMELLIADVARLRRLVDELMEISRLDAGREAVRSEQIDAARVVRTIIDARGWSDRVRIEAEPVEMMTDPRRLERIVGNLIDNGVEHGGGELVVGVRRDVAGKLIVTVADAGPGIEPHDLPHIFDRFYKADPARSGTGSGLGLAIALENARLLGGEIEVWSEPQAGTRFTLRVPVTEPLHGGDAAVSSDLQHEDTTLDRVKEEPA